MEVFKYLTTKFVDTVQSQYGENIKLNSVIINPTRTEFEGEYTIVLFPYVKMLKRSPQEIGDTIGRELINNSDYIDSFNLVKGFLNLSMSNRFWLEKFNDINATQDYGYAPSNGKKIMVEFASPNTNKPLHLGHIRNILLGWSCSMILEAAGYKVIKTQIVNDRGIAICKSMLAWSKFGNEETPTSTGVKGDHFVGKYYVLFEQKFQEEYREWQEKNEAKAFYHRMRKEEETEPQFFKRYKNEYFNQYSPIGNEAKEMLLNWEAGDEKTIKLWKKMNGWVYDGFDITYDKLHVDFDKLYYESETYLLGRSIVQEGLNKEIFYKKEDGSVWVNLEDAGLDHKIVLRKDGTAVYMTQDIGTAKTRYQDYGIDAMVYTVADEQDYHFQVLFEILKRLGEPYANQLHHLSYGMVDLPTGKMKSREGTVVDADDLIAEVENEARQGTAERGELDGLSKEQINQIIEDIALAALKYFIIKVNPKKRMVFDPKESVDMQGQTGPYIQNAYVRIKSILRKKQDDNIVDYQSYELNDLEKNILRQLIDYPQVIIQAANDYDPSHVAGFSYTLAKSFHKYYHDIRILNAESKEAKTFRLVFCKNIADVLKSSMNLLGISMPEKM